MKSAIALCVLFMVALTLAHPGGEQYTSNYDNINLDEIISNEKLLHNYFNCLLDKGKCTPEGKELRAHVEEAMKTGCAKCTEPQKKGTRRMIKHLINNKPEYWKELCAKYDPDNVYATKYEKELKELQS